MANTRSFLTGPIPTAQRVIGLLNNVRKGDFNTTGSKPVKPLLGFQNGGYLQVGTKTSAAGFMFQAGRFLPAETGVNMSLTINAGAGALAVSSNGVDVTVTLASGGSTAAAVVAAINAQFVADFCVATLNQGSAGGSNVAALTKTKLVSDNRYPAYP